MGKLRIHNTLIGLKQIDDNIFVPKNTEILKEALETGSLDLRHDLYVDTPINDRATTYHKIESFCTVATKEVKEEVCILITSLRQFHDQPIYVTCDDETRKFIDEQHFKDISYNVTCNKKDLEEVSDRFFKARHNRPYKFHQVGPIFKKMEAMNFALDIYNNTFFLDADIIVMDSLQEKFTKPVCLSPHYYQGSDVIKGFQYGFYNAGYVFTSDKSFPNIWKWLYLNDSSFYEQEGMNRIPEFIDVEVFSDRHNFGLWRYDRDKYSENIKSLHAHLSTNLDKNANPVHHKLNLGIRSFAVDYIQKNNDVIYRYCKDILHNYKLAFIHFGKCAGTYVNSYIRNRVLCNNTTILNSWHSSYTHEALKRDWTIDELQKIADNTLFDVKDINNQFTHNHHPNWDTDTIKRFKDNGWTAFTFLRHPGDLLCSLYFYSVKLLTEKNVTPIGPLGVLCGHQPRDAFNPLNVMNMSLDEFICECIDDESQHVFWTLPSYIPELSYVAEFNDKNFGRFLKTYFFHDYRPGPKVNTTDNKGYKYYRDSGLITDKTHNKLISCPSYQEYLTYLDQPSDNDTQM